jgi:hydrogenase expression/formation protein HypE
MADNDRPTIDPLAGMSCPIPISDYPTVLMAHGGGGKLTQQLIEKMFVTAFGKPLGPLHDGAVFSVGQGQVAFTTDSYVVNPVFFPGGSIGELAVNGTVNDLAMCGARPLYLSAAFVIEEGLAMDELWRIVVAMQNAAAAAGVSLVTGDTKVVDRGKGDKIFITTSGIGLVPPGIHITPANARPGDNIIINGPIAQHGIAIMSVREGLQFESPVKSDTAPLNGLVEAMLAAGNSVHVMRDATRGGVASVLNEIAGAASVGVTIDEESIPIDDAVRGACEILGFDPLYVANEGKLVAFVTGENTDAVLTAMRAHPAGKESQVIGKVVAEHPGVVVMKTRIGSSRVVDMLSGEQLPRIC